MQASHDFATLIITYVERSRERSWIFGGCAANVHDDDILERRRRRTKSVFFLFRYENAVRAEKDNASDSKKKLLLQNCHKKVLLFVTLVETWKGRWNIAAVTKQRNCMANNSCSVKFNAWFTIDDILVFLSLIKSVVVTAHLKWSWNLLCALIHIHIHVYEYNYVATSSSSSYTKNNIWPSHKLKKLFSVFAVIWDKPSSFNHAALDRGHFRSFRLFGFQFCFGAHFWMENIVFYVWWKRERK